MPSLFIPIQYNHTYVWKLTSILIFFITSFIPLKEKEMAAHSGILAWEIPWAEGPGGLLFMGSHSRSRLKRLSMHQRRNWQPTPVFLPGESQRQRSLVGCCLWGCTELDMVETTEQQQQHSFEIAKIPYQNLFRISKIIFVFWQIAYNCNCFSLYHIKKMTWCHLLKWMFLEFTISPK